MLTGVHTLHPHSVILRYFLVCHLRKECETCSRTVHVGTIPQACVHLPTLSVLQFLPSQRSQSRDSTCVSVPRLGGTPPDELYFNGRPGGDGAAGTLLSLTARAW